MEPRDGSRGAFWAGFLAGAFCVGVWAGVALLLAWLGGVV